MELEEMQNAWNDLSEQLKDQKQLTNKLIMEMTQQRFKNRFSKLASYETVGAVICYVTVIFILFNINKMDTWYLMACSIAVLIVLLVLPILSLRSIGGMRRLDLANNSYKDLVIEFSKKKKNMMLVQQLGAGLSIVLMWLTVPVFTMIADGNDFFKMDHSLPLIVFYLIVTAGVVIFSFWGYSRYKKITAAAERDLQELDI